MVKTIACVFVTHNHSDVVEQVLPIFIDPYTEHGIDIYYYDSSQDNKTKEIVESYIAKGYHNLFYVDVRFTKSPDEKLACLYNGYGLQKDYDYIWNVKDRCFFVGKTLDEIVNECQKGYDVVFTVNEEDRWEIDIPKYKDVYHDPVEFFSHYGQLTTNWECLIRKKSTMIDPIEWSFYLDGDELKKDNGFLQVMTLFNRLAEMDDISIRVIHNGSDKYYSMLTTSSWENIVFLQWIDFWVDMINGLPAIYDPYKLSIIQSETYLPVLFGSIDMLIHRSMEGTITREKFENYRAIWPLVSDIPPEYVDLVLENNLADLVVAITNNFVNALADHDYKTAYRIFINNKWLQQVYEEQYEKLEKSFEFYKHEMWEHGGSLLFKNVNTTDDLIHNHDMIFGS